MIGKMDLNTGSVRLAMWRDDDLGLMVLVPVDTRGSHDCDDREEHQEFMVDPAVWEWLSTPMIDEQLVFDDWLDEWSEGDDDDA